MDRSGRIGFEVARVASAALTTVLIPLVPRDIAGGRHLAFANARATRQKTSSLLERSSQTFAPTTANDER